LIFPDEAFAPSFVIQNEDDQVSNIVTVFETPAAASLSQKKTCKASPLPGTSSRVVPSTSNPDVVSAGREDVADMKKNAYYSFTTKTRTFTGLEHQTNFKAFCQPHRNF